MFKYENKNLHIIVIRSPNEIRYVGKTKQELKRRLQGHICDAHRSLKNNNYKNYNYNWINKEESLGNSIIITELDCVEFDEFECWKWLEQY